MNVHLISLIGSNERIRVSCSIFMKLYGECKCISNNLMLQMTEYVKKIKTDKYWENLILCRGLWREKKKSVNITLNKTA